MFRKDEEDYQLRYIYHTNQHNKAYLIELNLDCYDDLFNSWDGSALDRKELDPELSHFLERASYELPLKDRVELCFYLPESKKDEKMEADSRATIKNNFRMKLFFINQDLKQNSKKIATYILMGITFLITAYLIPESKDLSLLISLLMEGLFVGGWVFLWEAFSIFFFGSRELKDKKKRYFRYLDSNILFKYRE
ncbi:hypothetical protein C8C77_11840 [Halanaerobium saccharolyticum]|uniref:Uncharacterized protein n=1 Tax=Halanaerobium saccharolyticum TaxID=43595 RepID=A0A4R7YXG1_9FIRM|nr:hypothetical protein [Halanaerobium saccharolyticum]RAK07104.1 hypothetical protein C7958_11720 [Halanaerobium saccharolyticum]TDW01884.1 hypothetical protein C8C77_11840 [Halanaerobium saccharolyticum]TDX53130.1 hypothetical protein C7956_11840 [Halanaerobium saccharolyticum]